jgi:hypothetical protein
MLIIICNINKYYQIVTVIRGVIFMETNSYKIDQWDILFYISMAVLVGWIIAKALGY